MLDNNSSAFSSKQLEQIKQADQSLLDNLDAASEWVRNLDGEPDEPRAHWWWYLDRIHDKVMDTPNLESIYPKLKEKAG